MKSTLALVAALALSTAAFAQTNPQNDNTPANMQPGGGMKVKRDKMKSGKMHHDGMKMKDGKVKTDGGKMKMEDDKAKMKM